MSRKVSTTALKPAPSAAKQKARGTAAADKTDPRVLHTRDALGDALVQLMQEKPFETITVQHVLDRAGIGRSTFYAHYRDKDDLFMSDVEEFWEGMSTLISRRGEASDRVAPVTELFGHLAEAREFYEALLASGKIGDVLELGRGHFARGIEQRFAGLPRARGIAAERRPALARAQAGALFSLMNWWIDRGMPSTPEQMDDLFHQMLWGGATCTIGESFSRHSRPLVRMRS
jgi:AcrR family transcriptional regulator